jgi:hypothetical protein
MPVLNPTTGNPLTAGDIITQAFQEIGVLSESENLDAAKGNAGLLKLDMLLDMFNAKRGMIFNVNFTTYNLQANHQPHTIGPAATVNPDFVCTGQRPTKIVAANLVLTTSNPSVRVPLNIRDDTWWASQQIKQLTSTVPTDLYYSEDMPNGAIYLWPIPTVAYQLELEMWNSLALPSKLTDAFVFPQAYWAAIMYSLAELLSGPSFGQPLTPDLVRKALYARNAAMGNNNAPPRISTQDSGMPGGRDGSFNYMTGGPARR